MSTHRPKKSSQQLKHQHQIRRIFKSLGLIVLLLILIGAVGAGIHWKKATTETQLQQSRLRYEHKHQATTTSSTNTAHAKWQRAAMDHLKLGDLTKNGHNGAQVTTLIAKYGQPDQTKKGSEKGHAIKTLRWTNIAGQPKATFTLSTVKGRVYRKVLANYRLAKRATQISVTNYDNFTLQTTSYKKMTTDFGKPDTFEESLIDGTDLMVGHYTTNIEGSDTASIRLAFSNNLLIGKSQIGVE